MSHPMGFADTSMDNLKKNTPVQERFSFLMIFDINTATVDALLQNAAGMGSSGESYIADQKATKITMLTGSRFNSKTALTQDLSNIPALREQFNRSELRRGEDI